MSCQGRIELPHNTPDASPGESIRRQNTATMRLLEALPRLVDQIRAEKIRREGRAPLAANNASQTGKFRSGQSKETGHCSATS